MSLVLLKFLVLIATHAGAGYFGYRNGSKVNAALAAERAMLEAKIAELRAEFKKAL